MPIWKLIPIEETSDHWKVSTYKDYVIVRAADEDEAREKATLAFGIAARRNHGKDILLNPWNNPNLVTCQILKNSDFEEEGPAVVLFPKQS